MFLHNNHFCLIEKYENISFKQAIKELKDIFKTVDNFITEKKVNSDFKYELIPKKSDSHQTNFIVYDLETHNTDRARPYCISLYRLSILAVRYNGDLSQYELEECKTDTFVFDGDDCINKALDFLIEFKGERKVKNKIVEYNLQLHAHKGSGFDSWIIFFRVINNLTCEITFLVINTMLILLIMLVIIALLRLEVL